MTRTPEARFDCALPPERAAEQLAAARLPFRSLNPFRTGIVGSVSPERVKIRFSGPLAFDSGLRFVGAFVPTASRAFHLLMHRQERRDRERITALVRAALGDGAAPR